MQQDGWRFELGGMVWLGIIVGMILLDACAYFKLIPIDTFSEWLWLLQKKFSWTKIAILGVFLLLAGHILRI